MTGPTLTADDARLRRLSAVLSAASLLLAVLLPLATFWFWFAQPEEVIRRAGLPPSTEPALWQMGLGVVVALLPVLLLSTALLAARRCFRLFRVGAYLTREVVGALRSFGARVAAASLGAILVPPLLSLLLSIGNPPGSRALTFQLSSDTLVGLLVGGTLWALAAVMARAVALADEHAQIV
jgi:hypothetical protein